MSFVAETFSLLVLLIETWLQSHIPDTVIDIQGYNLIRRDRKNGQHGGVCIYIKDLTNYERINDLNNDHFEALWINLRMPRLPRGFNNLVIGTVYHPPSTNGPAMLDYLSSCLSSLESRFPNCGLIILGDFNRLSISRLIHSYNLCQLVK
jgi:exonuclease III